MSCAASQLLADCVNQNVGDTFATCSATRMALLFHDQAAAAAVGARMLAQPCFLSCLQCILSCWMPGGLEPWSLPHDLKAVAVMATAAKLSVEGLLNAGCLSAQHRDALMYALAVGRRVVQMWLGTAQQQRDEGAVVKLEEVVGAWKTLEGALLREASAADRGSVDSGAGSSSAGDVAAQRQAQGHGVGERVRGSGSKQAAAKACAVCRRTQGEGGGQVFTCARCKGILRVYYCGVSVHPW